MRTGHRFSCPLLALLVLLGAAPAAETPTTWIPAEHPAVSERSITAFTRPRRTLAVAAEVSGRVVAVAVDVGQRIAPGQASAVITLDDTQAVIARALAQAAVRAAEQAAGSSALALQAAEAEAALRERTAGRTRALAADGKLSAEELDTTVTAATLATLAMERARVATTQAATAVEQARLELQRAEDHLARHRIPAPAGWLVSARQVEPGALVAVGTPMLRVVDTGTLVVDLHLTTEEFTALRALPEPTLHFPRHGNRKVPAVLARIDAEFDPVTRKRRVELDLAGAAAPEALGGLEVAISFPLPDPSGALLVPVAFVRQSGERQSVRTQAGGEITVTVLRRQDGHLVVLPAALPAGVVLVP
jgi:multidrug efflux pump subunit AcrA (membrane-fusion protein)